MSPRSIDEPLPPPRRAPGFDEAGDATRRTSLAAERTLLAWIRTGLTVTAVALGVGLALPRLQDGARWPFVALGAAYAVLGVAVVFYGLWRGREVDRALREGKWIPLDDRVMWLVGLVTAALGLGAAALIVVGA